MYQYKTMQAIAKKFEKDHWPTHSSASNGKEYLYVQSAVFQVPFTAEFICRGDRKYISLLVPSLITGIPEEQTIPALACCNMLNKQWALFKFCLNGDKIAVSYDFPMDCDAYVADMAYTTFIALVTIINKIYPDLQKRINEGKE